MLTDAHLRSALNYARRAARKRRIALTPNLYLLRLPRQIALCDASDTELARVDSENYMKAYTTLKTALAGELA